MQVKYLEQIQPLIEQVFDHLGMRHSGITLQRAGASVSLDGVVHSLVMLKVRCGCVCRDQSRDCEKDVIAEKVRGSGTNDRGGNDTDEKNSEMDESRDAMSSCSPAKE